MERIYSFKPNDHELDTGNSITWWQNKKAIMSGK
jgi:plastocyanin